MKEKTIVSTVTLFTSLLAYWYSKETQKDPVPLVMMGGFVGSIIGEGLANKVTKSNKQI